MDGDIRVASVILEVLRAGGEISRKKLCERLVKSEGAFQRPNDVRDAVNYEAVCLVNDKAEKKVVYDPGALIYSSDPSFERSVQAYLHRELGGEMEQWQLYPFHSRKTTGCCFVGVSWDDVPPDPIPHPEYESSCDFRHDGDDRCDRGCGIEEEVLGRYGLV